MPQHKAVKDLQILATEYVSKKVIDIATELKNDLNGSNTYFTENLHATIRADILACTRKMLDNGSINLGFRSDYFVFSCRSPAARVTRKSNFSKWNGVINAMLDQGINQLPLVYIYENMEEELSELLSIFNRIKTNFQNLSVEFVNLIEFGEQSYLFKSVDLVKNFLENDVATRLGRLVLPQICNIEMLKIIGANTLCLKYLDISGSSCVYNMGIAYLLLKDNKFMGITDIPDTELCQMFNHFYNSKEMVNPCCSTIEELLFKKNSSTYTSTLMVLALVCTLKSVGNDLYDDKSAGDAVVSVWKNSPKPRIFELTDLHDSNLTADKLITFGECLPNVQKLMLTNFSSIIVPEQKSVFLSHVKTLKIELRSSDQIISFHKLMRIYGHNLVHLDVQSNEVDIDVAQLVKNCPNLQTIEGNLDILVYPDGQFSKLEVMYLLNPNAETTDWFFANCPCLEEAKIITDGVSSMINHIVINPPLIMRNNIKRLNIMFCGFEQLSHETVEKFITECSNLEELGLLSTWNKHSDITRLIKAFVQKKNYDLYVF